jgi:hypothetical protein
MDWMCACVRASQSKAQGEGKTDLDRCLIIFFFLLLSIYYLMYDDLEERIPTSPRPIPCHSHNDYWRDRPVFSALEAGCVGIEADVWLRGGKLWVGHYWEELPPPDRRDMTFEKLYVDRLLRVLEERNDYNTTERLWSRRGVYESDPSQTLVLLIDLKGEAEAMWQPVLQELGQLRERGWLTFYDSGTVNFGPITVVGTGNTDFEALTSNSTYRDVFFDAPLGQLERSDFDQTNSYYASVSFGKELGFSLFGFLLPSQTNKVRQKVEEAHERGLKVRYWNEPNWMSWVTRAGWASLADLGVDLLNVDDLIMFRKWWTRRQARK